MKILNKHIYFVPLLLGIVFFSLLHSYINYIDYKDITWASNASTPDVFLNDIQFLNLRDQILNRQLYLGADSYYWVLYASEMARDGKWRIRYNNYDNVPYGREVAWHSGYLWFLVSLGKLHSLLTGTELVTSIENSASFSNPIMLLLFTIFWSIVLGRKINPFVGGVFPCLIFFLWALSRTAKFGFVDHHGLHSMFFLSQFLSIIVGGAGFIQKPSHINAETPCQHYSLHPSNFKSARNWFVLGGLFGALGLWLAATQQSVLIGFIGIGGASTLLLYAHSADKDNLKIIAAPELWRWWGFTGAALSLLLYLLEYFPEHMSMHLEVNHPLYALAWAGGAEAIYRIGCLKRSLPGTSSKQKHILYLILALIGVLILPLSILFGPDHWHTVHDLIVRRTHDNIVEFRSPFDQLSPSYGILPQIISFGLLPLSSIAAAVILFWGLSNKYHRVLITQVFIPSIALLGLYFLQTRWDGLLAVCLVILTIVTTSATLTLFSRKVIFSIIASLILIIALIPGNYLYFKECYQGSRSESVNARLGILHYSILAREIAINLFFEAGGQEKRVISLEKSFAPMLAYFGVCRSVGSLYWLNHEGLRDHALFFGATDDKDALQIAQKRNLTHVIFKLSPTIADHVAWTLYGPEKENVLQKTLAYRLAMNPAAMPYWLKPFRMVYSPTAKPSNNIMYRIVLDRQNSTDTSNRP